MTRGGDERERRARPRGHPEVSDYKRTSLTLALDAAAQSEAEAGVVQKCLAARVARVTGLNATPYCKTKTPSATVSRLIGNLLAASVQPSATAQDL